MRCFTLCASCTYTAQYFRFIFWAVKRLSKPSFCLYFFTKIDSTIDTDCNSKDVQSIVQFRKWQPICAEISRKWAIHSHGKEWSSLVACTKWNRTSWLRPRKLPCQGRRKFTVTILVAWRNKQKEVPPGTSKVPSGLPTSHKVWSLIGVN